MDLVYIYFSIGFIVVFVFATNFFNQPGYSFVDQDHADAHDGMLEPALPMYLTERFEYNFFRATFVLVTECLYILLVLFLPDFNLATAGVEATVTGDNMPAMDTAASTPESVRERIILATLIISGMVPNLPWIKDLLEKSKLYLHKKAQIPSKGRAIYRRIKNGKPSYEKSTIERILNDDRYLGGDARTCRSELEADDFELGTWTLEARWAKLTYLLYFVDRWSLRFPFKSYIQNTELHYESIDTHYQQLFKLMVKYKSDDISGEEKLKLETGLDAALNRSYRLISCLLYLAAKSESVVDTYMDQLGYIASEHNEFPIPWNTVIWIIFAVCGSIIIGSMVALLILYYSDGPLPTNFSVREISSWIGYGTPFIIMPVLLVLLVKRYLSSQSDSWPTVTEQGLYHSIGERPWFIYFIVALLSYILGALVLLSLTASVNINNENFTVIATVRTILAWSSIVFVTAGYTAFRLDSGSRPDTNSSKFYLVRTAGALSQGIVTCGLVYIVTLYNADHPIRLIFDQNYALDPKIYILCVIGFFLGVSVNTASGIGRLRQRRKYGRRIARRKLRLRLTDQEASEAETLNISVEGALVSIKDVDLIRGEQVAHNTPVYLSSEDGHTSAEGKIIGKRGNHLHLLFENIENWSLLRNDLSLPAQP